MISRGRFLSTFGTFRAKSAAIDREGLDSVDQINNLSCPTSAWRQLFDLDGMSEWLRRRLGVLTSATIRANENVPKNAS